MYYIVREKESGITFKGTKGGYIGGTLRDNKVPPKLYTIGTAKSSRTFVASQHDDKTFEVVPVTLIYGEPL